jgi:hypothetical protein
MRDYASWYRPSDGPSHGPDELFDYFLTPDRHDGFQKGHMGSTSVEKDIAASWYKVDITHSTLWKNINAVV